MNPMIEALLICKGFGVSVERWLGVQYENEALGGPVCL